MTESRRAYRGTVQAEVAALTRQRIITAAIQLYESEWLDQVTLQRIAAEAGVTVQTILRHFGSREGLMLAAAAAVRETTVAERAEVPAGDLAAAVAYLVAHYEAVGDRMIRLLAQESRYPPLAEILQRGREIHRDWVERVFGPSMRSKKELAQLIPQLVAICDVYVWKLLRRDMGLGVAEYQAALTTMVQAVLPRKGDRA